MKLPVVSQSSIGEITQHDASCIPQQYRTRFFNPGELDALLALTRSVHAKRFVEFGCQNGRTAKVLIRNVPTIEEYIGIDVVRGYQTACAVQRGEVPAIPGELALDEEAFTLIVKPNGSYDVAPEEIGTVDIAFIDGDHSAAGVRNDTALALKCVRRGGVIVWHDYHDLGTVDVRDVLDEMKTCRGSQINKIENTWLAFARI